MMLNDNDCWDGQKVSTYHQHLIQQSSTRDRGCFDEYGVVTMDTDMGTSLATRKDYVFANVGRVALIFEQT